MKPINMTVGIELTEDDFIAILTWFKSHEAQLANEELASPEEYDVRLRDYLREHLNEEDWP